MVENWYRSEWSLQQAPHLQEHDFNRMASAAYHSALHCQSYSMQKHVEESTLDTPFGDTQFQQNSFPDQILPRKVASLDEINYVEVVLGNQKTCLPPVELLREMFREAITVMTTSRDVENHLNGWYRLITEGL